MVYGQAYIQGIQILATPSVPDLLKRQILGILELEKDYENNLISSTSIR